MSERKKNKTPKIHQSLNDKINDMVKNFSTRQIQ